MNSINGLDEMITEFSFGKIVVNGKTYKNDIKIVNGQVISKWWRKSGHRVAVEDITDVLEAEPEVVVIGKGSPGLLKSTASLRDYLAVNHIELIEKKTSEAVDVFNGLLLRGRKVAAGFHISC
ncbi:MAG: MTH938/NDUFAF3 family protein [Desulfobacterales bacterium]|jgi:hypothetical protein|nr:MTH938/NDUFAF3 family protein [Desulfobacterales bacterium]